MGIFDTVRKALSGKADTFKKETTAEVKTPEIDTAAPDTDPATVQATAEVEKPDESQSEPASAANRSYQVKSGDTIWHVAQTMYGDGARYPEIFEANTDLLDDPDHILPGQVLKIPD